MIQMESGKGIRMVFDCTPFFNEIDLLEMRMNILDPYVDYFLIEEATVTFSGEKKELFFEKYRDRFDAFKDKIIHVVVDDTPEHFSTHERDYYQKNKILEGLKKAGATNDDIIIMGDADEIPNPKVLENIIQNFDKTKVYHLAQRNFYGFINIEEKSGNILSITGDFPGISGGDRKWLGTKVTSMQNVPEEGIVRLRDIIPVTDERSVRIADGGWHFSYMGGCHETNPLERMGVKIKAAAHQEYNDREILAETMDRLVLGQDIFGRDARFERVEIDDTFPEYLRNHIADYDYLVMPRITFISKVYHKLDITVGRFCRKAYHKIIRMIRKRN